MPLFKQKPFTLSEPPKDIKPDDPVYQVRFTKEIFCDYREYLNRLNLYRWRKWTCKVTGKINLTYEEALVSEMRAAEKVQQFPKELTAPALGIIQFSMLTLKDLTDAIATKLQECFYVGVELYGKKDDDVFPCKIVKVLEGGKKIRYKVAWLDENKETIETTTVNGEDLVHKKLPYSKNDLKSFIRESTYRNAPWVIHNKLALKYGISTDPPEELKNIISFQNGLIVGCKKRKKEENSGREDVQVKEPIKYPIDDLLVQPGSDDPVFTDRPSPSRDFNVPMDCVGDLLMVWEFCSSFGRQLHLWPFSLEDFENAICHKDSNLVLIAESHTVLLQLLINDNGEYLLALQEKKRKLKITSMKWTEYLCDFIDMINIPELCTHTPTIKRGQYGHLDAHAKLKILCELVNQVLETTLIRRKLDEYIEKQLALGARRRGDALEEGRKKKEEKKRLKTGSDCNKVIEGHDLSSAGNNLHISATNIHSGQNGDIANKGNAEVFSAQRNCATEKSNKKHVDAASKKIGKQLKTENVVENREDQPSNDYKDEAPKQLKSNKEESPEQLKGDQKEARKKSSKEQRKEHFERQMERLFVRTNPLGKDRYYNRYWWFHRDGRIFVECSDSKQWGYYSTVEELDALMGSLNYKGEREKALHEQLGKFYSRICSEYQKRSKELAYNIKIEEAILRRSTRVRAPPRDDPANAFMRYVNKWR